MSGYIAELKIKVDSTELQSATKQLKDFAQATTTTGQAEQKVRKAREDSSKATEKAEQRASKAEQDRYDKWFAGASRRDKEESAIQSRRDAIMSRNVRDSAQNQAAEQKATERAAAAEEKRYQKTLQQLDKRTQAETKALAAQQADREKANKTLLDQQSKAAKAVADAETKAQKDALKEQQALDKIRYNSTLKRYSEETKLAAQAEKQTSRASASVDKEAKSMQNLLAAIDPVTREMQRLDALEKSLQANRGKISTEQYQKYQNVIDQTRQKVSKYNDTMGRTSLTAKQLQMAQMGLAPQFTDIIVSLQGGQAPLTVFLQQGGQIKDMFGGVTPAIKGVSSAIAGLISPATVAGSALALLGVAWYSGAGTIEDLNKAIINSGNAAGTTAGQLRNLAQANSEGAGSVSQNIQALQLLVANGKLVPETYGRISEAAANMAAVTGESVESIVEDFTSLGKEPVEAAVKLNEKYNFLTASTYAQAQALSQQGKEQEAIKLLTNELADVMETRSKRMEENARGVAAAWRTVTKAVSDAWTATAAKLNPTLENDLTDINEKIANYESKLAPEKRDGNSGYQYLIAERQKLVDTIYEQRTAAQDEAKDRKQNNAAIDVQTEGLKKQRAAYTAVKKAQEDLAEFERKVTSAGNKINPADVTKYRQVYKDALTKAEQAEKDKLASKTPKSAIIDNTDVNDLKNRVSEIKAQYKSMNEGVKEQLEAGKLTSEQAFEKRKSLITQESVETKAAYEEQIAGLEKLKSSKNISANQTISLDRQISDARTKMVVAEEDAQKRLSSTDADENKRLKTKTRNIEAYSASLSQMVENLRVAGERERAGLGQSSGQRDLSSKLTSEDDRYNNEVRGLNDQAAENPLLANEVEIKLAKAAKAHTDMKDQIVRNYDDMKTAQMDWAAGVSSAFQQYVEDGQNYASMSNQAFTSAFGNMESALNSFVTTGKASFADLTKAILADMAKIAIKAAASQALTAMFSAFAPSPTSLGSTAAGYTDQFFKQHAKGGAFAGGTQFFAKGGAFTNSVVSKPTAFTSASGSNNVMGEAGPEAIMPLTRGSDGSLGVRAQVDLSGLQQQGGGVQVNIQIDGQGNSSTASSDPGYSSFGKEVGQFVDQRYRQLISKDLSAGGDIWKVMNGG
jgi:lambda family phage tail tape measure protein